MPEISAERLPGPIVLTLDVGSARILKEILYNIRDVHDLIGPPTLFNGAVAVVNETHAALRHVLDYD